MSRVLLFSRDRSGLDPASATAGRWRLLVREGQELIFIILSPVVSEWSEPGLHVIGTGGAILPTRLVRAYLRSRRESALDLLSAQDPLELGALALWIGKARRIPVEIQDHGGFFDGQSNGEPYWWVRRLLVWWAQRSADFIRTVSPYSQEMLVKARKTDTSYWLPIAPHDRFRRLSHAPESGLVVAVGRLVSVKQFDVLLEAIAFLRERVSGIRLVMVGDGPEREHLRARTRALGLTGVVEFVGAQDPAPYLTKASVFAMPSLHEGWGVAAVEAALVGVPVVMSATGCAAWLEAHGNAEVIPLPISLDVFVAALERGLLRKTVPLQGAPSAEDVAIEQIRRWQGMMQLMPIKK